MEEATTMERLLFARRRSGSGGSTAGDDDDDDNGADCYGWMWCDPRRRGGAAADGEEHVDGVERCCATYAPCCCVCPCPCPVIVDLVWEHTRSRWVPLLLVLFMLHELLVDELLSWALGWPTCADAYAIYDHTPPTSVLDNPQVAGVSILMQVLGTALALMATSRFQSRWYLLAATPTFLAGVVLRSLVDTRGCFRLAAADAAQQRDGGGLLSIPLPGNGIFLPVAVINVYHFAVWCVLLIVAALLLNTTCRHVVCRRRRGRRGAARHKVTAGMRAVGAHAVPGGGMITLADDPPPVGILSATPEEVTPLLPPGAATAVSAPAPPPLSRYHTLTSWELPPGAVPLTHPDVSPQSPPLEAAAAAAGTGAGAVADASVATDSDSGVRPPDPAETLPVPATGARGGSPNCLAACCGTCWRGVSAGSRIFATVPLRVGIATSFASLLAIELTAGLMVVAVMLTPVLNDFVHKYFSSTAPPPPVVAGQPVHPAVVALSRLVAAVALQSTSAASTMPAARQLGGRALGDDTDGASILLSVPNALRNAVVAGAVFACATSLAVCAIAVLVYYGLHLEYWAQERRKDAAVTAAVAAAPAGTYTSAASLRQLRASLGYVPADLGQFTVLGRAAVRLSRSVEGQLADSVATSDAVQGAVPETTPAGGDSTGGGGSSGDGGSSGKPTVATDAAAAASASPAPPPPAPPPPPAWRRCVYAIYRACASAPVAPQIGPGGLPLERVSFSGAFGYIPFFVLNVVFSYFEVFVLVFVLAAALSLPVLQDVIRAAVVTMLLTTLLPLAIRTVLLGWLLADGTRIKHRRLFLLVDTVYSFTVGAVVGISQAILRLMLVLLWSMVRSTQLHAPLGPRTSWGSYDPGFSTHASVMKCKYASGLPPVHSAT